MKHNKRPISLGEGRIFLNGVEISDGVACAVNFTPKVWNGKQLGERSDSSRWLGFSITGSITRRRSTPFIKDQIKQYRRTGRTPELTIQGINNDRDSDYFAANGSDTTTLVGVVLTGDLPLTRLDSGGEVVDDVINFSAKDMV